MEIPNLFFLMLNALDLKDKKTAEEYVDKIHTLAMNHSLPFLMDFYNVGQAMIKGQSSRYKEKSTAEQLLKSYLRSKGQTNTYLKIRAFLAYANLLIDQLDLEKDPEEIEDEIVQ